MNEYIFNLVISLQEANQAKLHLFHLALKKAEKIAQHEADLRFVKVERVSCIKIRPDYESENYELIFKATFV